MASIIVVSHDRRESLEELLRSVRELSYDRERLEVVVVDNYSTDGTAEAAQRLARECGGRLSALKLPRRLSAGAARNAGCREARGDVLVFVDSDCRVHRDWLERLVEPFRDPQVGIAGGADRFDPTQPDLARCVDHVLTSFSTTGGLRGSTRRKCFRFLPRTFNMAVRRDIFDEVRGFEDRTYGEDILLSATIRSRGYRIAHVPEACVFHKRRAGFRAFARQVFRMGRGRGEVSKRCEGLLQPQHFIPSLHLLSALTLVSVAPLSPLGRTLLLGYAVAMAFLLAVILVDFWRRTRLVRFTLHVVALFYVQQFGYGAGLLVGLLSAGRGET